jgi:hypothetical protein
MGITCLKRLSGVITAFICMATLTLVVVFAVKLDRNWSSNYQARSCESAIETRCNAEELRNWALGLLENEHAFATNRPTAHSSLQGIWKHKPSVEVRGAVWGNKGPGYVFIGWGSGVLGGWGLAIGSADLPPPRDIGDSVRPWKPGIYFWRSLQ